jgi:hypothetical protein
MVEQFRNMLKEAFNEATGGAELDRTEAAMLDASIEFLVQNFVKESEEDKKFVMDNLELYKDLHVAVFTDDTVGMLEVSTQILKIKNGN